MTTGSAGLTGSIVEVGDGYGTDTDAGAVECYSSRNGILFGTGGEAVGGVLDVAAGDDGGWGCGEIDEQECCPNPKVTVGSVGVVGGSVSALLQQIDLGGGEWGEWWGERHDASEAIGCGCRRQGGGL